MNLNYTKNIGVIIMRKQLREKMIEVCDKKIEESIKDLLDLLNEEINVKKINFERNTSKFMKKSIRSNHASIGKRLHEKAKIVLSKIEEMDKEKLYEEISKNDKIFIKEDKEKITLTKDDFLIIEKEKENIAKTEIENITYWKSMEFFKNRIINISRLPEWTRWRFF